MATDSKNKPTQQVICIKVSDAGKSIWYAVPINEILFKNQSTSKTKKIQPATLNKSPSTKDRHERSGFCSIGSIMYAIGGVDLQDKVEQFDLNNPQLGWVRCSSFGKMICSRPDHPRPVVVNSKIYVFSGVVDKEIRERENWGEVLDFHGSEKEKEERIKALPPIPFEPLSDYDRINATSREIIAYNIPKNDGHLLIAPLKMDEDSSDNNNYDIIVSNKTSVYVKPKSERRRKEAEGEDGKVKLERYKTGIAVTMIYKCGIKEWYRLEDLSDPPPDGFNMNSYKNYLRSDGVVGDHGTTVYWYDKRCGNRIMAYDYVKNIWYGRAKIQGLKVYGDEEEKVDDLWNPVLLYVGDDVFCLVGLLDGCLLVHGFKVIKKIMRPLPQLLISKPIWSRIYQVEDRGVLMNAILVNGVSKSYPGTHLDSM